MSYQQADQSKFPASRDPPVDYTTPKKVLCDCKRTIFDGTMIHARVINLADKTAKCRCSRWVPVPILFDSEFQFE